MSLIEQKRRQYARHYKSSRPLGITTHVTVPADIEVRTESAPCFRCGTRAGVSCKHRPHGESGPSHGFSLTGGAAAMMVEGA